MKPEKENTFCYYPFWLLAIKSWDKNGFTKASPCCNALRPESPVPLGNFTTEERYNISLSEVFNGKAMQEIRTKMLQGERPAACKTCWKIENRGGRSYRLLSDHPWKREDPHRFDDINNLENPVLAGLDLSYGNNCNLRCRMCRPGLSNKLIIDHRIAKQKNLNLDGIEGWSHVDELFHSSQNESEHKIVGGMPYDTTIPQVADIIENIGKIKHIKGSGGEPTLSENFISLIDAAIEKDSAKNMILEFHSNSTKFNDQLVNKLLKFKEIRINASVDSHGVQYEYIRYPMKWRILDSSIRNILSKFKNSRTSKLGFMFTSVYSVLSAFHIKDLIEYFDVLRKEYTSNTCYFAPFNFDVIWPENKFINVKFLPKPLKKHLIDDIVSLESKYHIIATNPKTLLESTLDLEITEEMHANMKREIQIFDITREQDYHNYLHPLLIDFLDRGI